MTDMYYNLSKLSDSILDFKFIRIMSDMIEQRYFNDCSMDKSDFEELDIVFRKLCDEINVFNSKLDILANLLFDNYSSLKTELKAQEE